MRCLCFAAVFTSCCPGCSFADDNWVRDLSIDASGQDILADNAHLKPLFRARGLSLFTLFRGSAITLSFGDGRTCEFRDFEYAIVSTAHAPLKVNIVYVNEAPEYVANILKDGLQKAAPELQMLEVDEQTIRRILPGDDEIRSCHFGITNYHSAEIREYLSDPRLNYHEFSVTFSLCAGPGYSKNSKKRSSDLDISRPKSDLSEFVKQGAAPFGEKLAPNDLRMLRSEITTANWYSIMGTKPWKRSDIARHVGEYPLSQYPVDMVSRDEALEYCERLTQRMRNNGSIESDQIVRLPTIAEWRLFQSCGRNSRWHFGEDSKQLSQFAHFGDAVLTGGLYRTRDLEPNDWGLWDLCGNAAELGLDTFSRPFGSERRHRPHHPVLGGHSRSKAERTAVGAELITSTTWHPQEMIGFRVVVAPNGEADSATQP